MPEGVEIEGRIISWTQNGYIYAQGKKDASHAEIIGTYERLVENELTHEHIIVIYLDEVETNAITVNP